MCSAVTLELADRDKVAGLRTSIAKMGGYFGPLSLLAILLGRMSSPPVHPFCDPARCW